MSDLAATNCGNSCGCNGGYGNILWILVLLCACGNGNGNGIFGNGGCDNGFFGNGDCCNWIFILLLLSCCGNF